MIYPSDSEYERVGHILYESLQTGRVTSADATFRRKDGSLIDGHVRMKAFGLSDLRCGLSRSHYRHIRKETWRTSPARK